MTERLLADITKNGRERIRVQLSRFRGSTFVDLRTFATDRGGALVPTPKGVSLRPDMLQATIEALQQAERALAEPGRAEGRT